MVSGYYDDFSQIEAARLAASAEACFKRLFELLGLDLALDDHKGKRFARVFSPLVLTLISLRVVEGMVKVQPKQSRVSKVIEVGCAALGCDLLSESPSLSGWLQPSLEECGFG